MKLILALLMGATSGFAQWDFNIFLEQNFNDTETKVESNQQIGLYTHYKFEKNGKLTLRLETMLKDSEVSVLDGRLRFRNNIHDVGNFSYNSDLRLGLGFSESSREASPLLTYITWAPSVSINLSEKADKTKFSLIYKPYFSRRVLKSDYQDTVLGSVVARDFAVKHDIYNLFMLDVAFLERFNLTLGYGYTMQWNFNGSRVDDNHDLWQELAIKIDDTFSILLGHANSGLVYDADGAANSFPAAGNNSDSYYAWLMIDLDL